MTRETKLGLVVSGSFVCLVGAVLFTKLNEGEADKADPSAAQNVRTAIGAAIVYEGHNANSPGSHGISIDFSSSTEFSGLAGDYQQLRFGQETQWDEWLTIAP